MRRSDRALTPEQSLEVLGRCPVCRLAVAGDAAPYIVPLNFALCDENGETVLYFHSANVGRKLDLIAQNPRVGFEADAALGLIEGPAACNYSMGYESVIGVGTITRLTDREEKRRALSLLMAHYSNRTDFTFPDERVDSVAVLRLVVESMTGKRRSMPEQHV